jgi:hypothetical protein
VATDRGSSRSIVFFSSPFASRRQIFVSAKTLEIKKVEAEDRSGKHAIRDVMLCDEMTPGRVLEYAIIVVE